MSKSRTERGKYNSKPIEASPALPEHINKRQKVTEKVWESERRSEGSERERERETEGIYLNVVSIFNNNCIKKYIIKINAIY